MAKRRYSVPALERSLDIVELLADSPEPLAMRAIGARLGRSAGEIFRHLKALEARGYVARDAGDRYALTNHLFELAMRRPRIADLVDIATPTMREAAARLRQSVHLAVANGREHVIIARIESPGDVGMLVRIGNHRDLVAAVSGRVLLAYQPPAVRREWLSSGRGRGPSPALDRRLGLIRRRGYEISPSAFVVGVTDVSCPILDGEHAVAAMTSPMVQRRGAKLAIRESIQIMTSAAARVSAEFARAAGRKTRSEKPTGGTP